jgi:hypothetical protein
MCVWVDVERLELRSEVIKGSEQGEAFIHSLKVRGAAKL